MRFQVEHETPLMHAIRKDNQFAVDKLIKAEATVDYENKVLPCDKFSL